MVAGEDLARVVEDAAVSICGSVRSTASAADAALASPNDNAPILFSPTTAVRMDRLRIRVAR
jgi:hypothetical protein